MSARTRLPIACDLGALSSEQRAREQTLLAELKTVFAEFNETERGFRVVLPPDPALLGTLGEFLALERICCPFLNFELAVSENRGPVTLDIHGGPGVKPFLLSVFFGKA
jgi:hypothetical protein